MKVNRPVFFCGENPGMTLYLPGTKQISSVVSYWHCTDSRWGTGNALVLWMNGEAASDPVVGNGGIFSNNLDLANMLVKDLTQHFPEFEDVPTATLKYVEASCDHTFEDDCYRVECRSADAEIVIDWKTVLDRKQIIWPDFPAGPKSFDLTTVICPCQSGQVKINGNFIKGEVEVTKSEDGYYKSSAFLAFAETWIGPLDKNTA